MSTLVWPHTCNLLAGAQSSRLPCMRSQRMDDPAGTEGSWRPTSSLAEGRDDVLDRLFVACESGLQREVELLAAELLHVAQQSVGGPDGSEHVQPPDGWYRERYYDGWPRAYSITPLYAACEYGHLSVVRCVRGPLSGNAAAGRTCPRSARAQPPWQHADPPACRVGGAAGTWLSRPGSTWRRKAPAAGLATGCTAICTTVTARKGRSAGISTAGSTGQCGTERVLPMQGERLSSRRAVMATSQ